MLKSALRAYATCESTLNDLEEPFSELRPHDNVVAAQIASEISSAGTQAILTLWSRLLSL